MNAEDDQEEELAGPNYFCGVCSRPAPRLDSTEILAWHGGDMVMAGISDPLMLGLVCPDCSEEESPAA